MTAEQSFEMHVAFNRKRAGTRPHFIKAAIRWLQDNKYYGSTATRNSTNQKLDFKNLLNKARSLLIENLERFTKIFLDLNPKDTGFPIERGSWSFADITARSYAPGLTDAEPCIAVIELKASIKANPLD